MRKRKTRDKMFLPVGILRGAYAERLAEANKDDFEREFVARSLFRMLPSNAEAAHRMLTYAAECIDAFEREMADLVKQRRVTRVKLP